MNLRQLEVFRAVMESGSTKDAARLLLISQPAVSNMIRQFEDQLGFSLFRRTGGRLHATPEAGALYQKTDNLFSVFDGIQGFAEDLRDSQAGSLKILASPSFGQVVIPNAIAAFMEDHPAVTISFDTPPHENIVELLVAEKADFALTITPVEHPGIESQVIEESRLVCIVPKDHPLAGRDNIQPHDLMNVRLISYPRSSPIGHVVNEAFLAVGIFQKISIKVRFCYTASTLVNSGTGVAIVDEFAVNKCGFDNLEIKPFETEQKLTISLSHPQMQTPSRLSTTFIGDYLRRALRR